MDVTRLRLLDYGCGNGAFLVALREVGLGAQLTGCDPSAGMLAEAGEGWTAGAAPAFHLVRDARAPFADGSFEVVVLSAVLHHLLPDERDRLLADALRVLAPGGRLVVFEHNPLNPLTRWVVRHTPIDRNAHLLGADEVRRRLHALGVERALTRFLLFFPPRFRTLWRLERWLAWFPLGGQYVVVGQKSSAPR
jgi:SAM-dependent methyltransferase